MKISMRLASLTVEPNRRSRDASTRNRIVVQLVAPSNTDHPTTTFSYRSPDGEAVPDGVLEKEIPFRILFKNVEFTSVFGEPLLIRIHHFQDTQRDKFQQLTGRFIEILIGKVLEGVSVVGVPIAKLIGLSDSLKLSAEVYSQKLGSTEISIPGDEVRSGQRDAVCIAGEDVAHFVLRSPSGRVVRETVVREGATTATMGLELAVS